MFFFGSKRWLFKLWKVRWVFKDLRRRGGNNEKNVYQSTTFLWWKGLQSTWTRQLYQTMQQYTMLKRGETPLVSHYVLLYSWRFHWLVHGHMNMQWNRFSPSAMTSTGNSSLLPEKRWTLLHLIRGGLMLSLVSQCVFQNLLLFCFVFAI